MGLQELRSSLFPLPWALPASKKTLISAVHVNVGSRQSQTCIQLIFAIVPSSLKLPQFIFQSQSSKSLAALVGSGSFLGAESYRILAVTISSQSRDRSPPSILFAKRLRQLLSIPRVLGFFSAKTQVVAVNTETSNFGILFATSAVLILGYHRYVCLLLQDPRRNPLSY